jgi:hypothetical protein
VVVGFAGWWVVGEPLEGLPHHGCLSVEQFLAELAVAVDDDEFDAAAGFAEAAPATAQRLDRTGSWMTLWCPGVAIAGTPLLSFLPFPTRRSGR